jgi:hypothetical protein
VLLLFFLNFKLYYNKKNSIIYIKKEVELKIIIADFINFLLNNKLETFITLFFIFIFYTFHKISFKLKNKFLYFLFTFPGTLMHELAHFIVGIFLNGKPVGFSLIPKKDKKGYTLGSVSFKNMNYINSSPIGLAPLLLLPISLFFLYKSVFYLKLFIENTNNTYYLSMYVLCIYLAYTAFISCIPSDVDIKNGVLNIKGIISLIFWMSFFYILFFIF